MAVSHVKSNPVANMTGTVTVFNSAGVTTTAAATDLVRPVDWNSVHNQFMTIGGNTAGASTLSGTNIELHGSGAVTLSGNGQTIVFSAPTQSVQTQGSVQVQGSSGAISFANGNGITFGGNASTITASHNGLTSQSNQAFSAGNGSATFQTLTFADSNGVSFSTGTQGLVATVKTDYASSNHSHGNPTLALTNLSGTTASNSAGLTLSLSAAAPGGGGGVAAAAGTQTATSGTINFVNSNGVTFGMSGSSQITASYTVPTQTAQTVGVYGIGNTTGQSSSSTVDARSLSIQGAGIASVGMSNGTIIVSAVAAGAGDGGNTLAAGTQSASTNGFVKFENSNGITFGMSGSTQITASHNGLTTARASNDAIGLNTAFTAGPLAMTINSSGLSLNAGSAAGTTSGFTGGASISGSMTHNTAGLAISLSHPAWITTGRASNDGVGLNTAQTNVTWTVNSSGISLNAAGYAGTGTTFNGTNASASMTLNSNGLRLDLSAANGGGGVNSGTFYATGNTTQSSSGTIALSSIIVQGTGGVSAGVSNGSIVVSGPALTSLSATGALSASSNGSTISLGVGAVTLSATGNTTQASSGTVNLNGLILQGAGGASVGVSNGSIVISGAAGGGGGAAISAGANSQSTGTVNFANSNGITFGLSNNGTMTASYNSTQFAGTGTTFAGANISASMTLNSNGLNLSASVAAPGAAAEQNAMNLLGANTAGNTTATGSTIGLSGLNVTLSGTNASQIVISAPATSSLAATGGVSISTNGSTISIGVPNPVLSFWNNMDNVQMTTIGQQANNSASIIPLRIDENASATRFEIFGSQNVGTQTNNSSGAINYSLSVYIATLNGLTLSTLSSGSTATGTTWSSNNTASVTGGMIYSAPLNANLTPARYYAIVQMSTAATGNVLTGAATTSLANTISLFGAGTAQFGAVSFRDFTGGASNSTIGVFSGGLYSSTGNLTQVSMSAVSQAGTFGQRGGAVLVRLRAI